LGQKTSDEKKFGGASHREEKKKGGVVSGGEEREMGKKKLSPRKEKLPGEGVLKKSRGKRPGGAV